MLQITGRHDETSQITTHVDAANQPGSRQAAEKAGQLAQFGNGRRWHHLGPGPVGPVVGFATPSLAQVATCKKSSQISRAWATSAASPGQLLEIHEADASSFRNMSARIGPAPWHSPLRMRRRPARRRNG